MFMTKPGFENNGKPNAINGFENLKKLAQQEKADDKFGSFAATTQILLVAGLATYLIWSVIVTIFPPALAQQYREFRAKMEKKSQEQLLEHNKNKTKSIFDYISDLVDFVLSKGHLVGSGGVVTVSGAYYIKKRRQAGKAGKSAMDIAIEEEMRRLKIAMEKEDGSSSDSNVGGNSKKAPSVLDGATLVELFNNFADIMAIRGDLPRDTEETAAEYFNKLSKEIRFSPEKATKAARYFEDELYGKIPATSEDKRAFMELLLEMMSKSKKA